MKKLHSFVLSALVTPAIALSSGAVLGQQATDQDADREQQSTQRDQTATQSGQSAQSAKQSDSKTAADSRNTSDPSSMQEQAYLGSAPANGMQASDLIGAGVRTTSDEEVGSVNDLIIDENGQVVAIVVGVGGFLGLGEKEVAIGWGNVTRSGGSEEPELGSDELVLRIDSTPEDLRSAPEFERQE